MVTAKEMLTLLYEYQIGDKLGDKIKKNITKTFALEDMDKGDILVVNKTERIGSDNDIHLKVMSIGKDSIRVKDIDRKIEFMIKFNDIELIDAFSRKDKNTLIVTIDLPNSIKKEII
jgi:hypothetical protein